MDHDQIAREAADTNARRFYDLTDAEIRVEIARIKDGLSGVFGYGVGLGAMGREGIAREDLHQCRTELLRRACTSFGLPMLGHLQALAIKQAKDDGKLETDNSRITVLCLDLCEQGLMTDQTRDILGKRSFRLTPMAHDILEAADDVAVSLARATEVFCASIMASYSATPGC